MDCYWTKCMSDDVQYCTLWCPKYLRMYTSIVQGGNIVRVN